MHQNDMVIFATGFTRLAGLIVLKKSCSSCESCQFCNRGQDLHSVTELMRKPRLPKEVKLWLSRIADPFMLPLNVQKIDKHGAMRMSYIITISLVFVAIILSILYLKDNNDLASILNQQIGTNIERSHLDKMLGKPVGELVRGDILELHYEFKVMKPEIYQRCKFVGVVVKVKDGKMISWNKMF